MKKIEEKFKDLPNLKLSLKSDYKIRLTIYKMALKKKLPGFSFGVVLKQKMVLAVFLLFVLSLSVLPGYAYASSKVTIGHVLYPVKKVIENVELKISDDKPEKLLKFSLRRIEEANVIAEDESERENVKELIDNASDLRGQAVLNMSDSRAEVDSYTEKGLEKLTEVAKKVGIFSGDDLLDTVALTIEEFSPIKSKTKKEKKQAEEKIKEKKTEKNTDLETHMQLEVDNDPKDNQIKKQEKDIDKKQDLKNEQEENVKQEEKKKKEEKEEELFNLKNDVVELSAELKKNQYKSNDVDLLIEKLNTRIGHAEKNSDKKEVEKIINNTKAIKNNAKFFLEKEEKSNNGKGNSSSGKNKNNKK